MSGKKRIYGFNKHGIMVCEQDNCILLLHDGDFVVLERGTPTDDITKEGFWEMFYNGEDTHIIESIRKNEAGLI
ncbi:MAG: hypothetical protein WCY05_06285 [Candidatus Omnitrophota bacterium]